MALLVMRVTGELQGRAFYPHLAGVGFSYNPFVWGPEIDPKAGVLRLVYGLGTRAVDRVDDDYTRVVALNAPLRRPEGSLDEIVRHIAAQGGFRGSRRRAPGGGRVLRADRARGGRAGGPVHHGDARRAAAS